MTREEAIRWLEDIHRRFNPTGENLENEGGDVHLQALDMAIEALSADAARCKECEVKAYTEKLVDAFIEDGEELADSVKVVRCKDCKHRDEKCGMGEHRWCKILKMSTVPNDFCSYAERREP